MRARPYSTAPNERGTDAGSDRYVDKRWEYSACATVASHARLP
jgi:hypothetical protein